MNFIAIVDLFNEPCYKFSEIKSKTLDEAIKEVLNKNFNWRTEVYRVYLCTEVEHEGTWHYVEVANVCKGITQIASEIEGYKPLTKFKYNIDSCFSKHLI